MKRTIASLALFCCWLLPRPALAFDNCANQVRKAENNYDKAARKWGEHSSQAQNRRHQLEEARERCRGRWGNRDHDRDRDKDRDRDRDRDRDHDRDRDGDRK
jgi:hypothetical protein